MPGCKFVHWVIIGCFVTGLVSPAVAVEKEIEALIAAQKWLEMVDSEDYDECWASAAVLFKNAIQPQQWEQAMRSGRQPLGKLISRKLIVKNPRTSIPGAPDGHYIVFQFDTSFQHKKKAVETITPMLCKDGIWRVSGYFIK